MIYNVFNISIIAHVDYGKTTFFNSLINFCKNYKKFNKNFFFINNNKYTIKNNLFSFIFLNKIINFIDCPGHFDFIFEIYKSIYLSDFCFILIDLKKKIEVQTLFCFNLSKKLNKKIFIIINKIDVFLKFENIKKKILKNFGLKNKIFYISAKYSLGIFKIFFLNNKNIIYKNKIIFVIDFLFHFILGYVLIIKVIKGEIYLLDYLKNKYDNFIKIIKIGIFIPKSFFLKKTFLNCIHFFLIKNKFINNNYFFFDKVLFYNFKKPIILIYFDIFLENDFFLLKLLENDFSINYKKKNSKLFGKGYSLGFLGNFHSFITFKKISILTKFYVTDCKIYYLIKEKNNWYFNYIEKDNIYYEQIMKTKIYILKKNFFKIFKYLLSLNFSKFKIINNNDIIIIIFYLKLNIIINNFFIELQKNINFFIFYEFFFHHFFLSNVKFISVLINNKIINELNFISINNLKNSIFFFYNKLKKNFKNKIIDIKIQFLHKNKIFFTKKINCYKKNVIDKCYGGDISRKLKLLKKQNIGKLKLLKKQNIILEKNILLNLMKNEKSYL
ncbi:GTP-binding protein LepA [Candidatus Carsonella ruddii CS isolate Thao2000]|uniref:GTP-binding protein LepA n=1 Tax=Candidatus Carsonella ruddii CS isolate Thao2000 TaxID=1202537 RepID=J7GTB7_CARRU|nr:GTP-binding protein [Candidatus Carsonella ruddii]AFP83769.1 GTP-binding protein LepA [Candidatus Carsonella ruddii CS isolate Thao2000]